MRKRKEIRAMIHLNTGLPGHDPVDGIKMISRQTFPDGANYRTEVSGIESVNILKATIDEAKKRKVPFHKAISFVKGSSYYDDEELKEFAKIANGEGIEVIVTPGPRPTWYASCKQAITPEGAISGLRLRGTNMVVDYLHDLFRCIDLGFRGFLVWDEGVLMLLKKLKEAGKIPKETTFKVSIFAGHANVFGAQLLEWLGAGSFNPVADLTIPQLASIRSGILIPMDIHIELWASMGGYNRAYETIEIARVSSPCYFKMERGPGLAMYLGGMSDEGLAQCARDKVKALEGIIRYISENSNLKVSEKRPEGLLGIPVV